MRYLLAALGFSAALAQACLNTYEEELIGQMHRGSDEEVAATLQRLDAEYAARPTPETTNDLAVAHIVAGKYDVAIDLLTALEQRHPGLSRTASNLGTALELAGRNAEALRWVREGIARDPADHFGTEWLHVKILEAKLALAQDPQWLQSRRVLGVDFGREARPVLPAVLPQDHAGRPRTLEDMEKAMDYQLRERMKFVTAPDPLVGDLYLARADIAWLLESGRAGDFYLAAAYFKAPDAELVERRRERWEDDREWTSEVGWTLLLLGGGPLAYRRLRRQRTPAPAVQEG
ncbi:MAG: repeat-containing protein [Moraxellaceae bacterium]|nr:repeat-containing protein [Moraxellaceae bacterium]